MTDQTYAGFTQAEFCALIAALLATRDEALDDGETHAAGFLTNLAARFELSMLGVPLHYSRADIEACVKVCALAVMHLSNAIERPEALEYRAEIAALQCKLTALLLNQPDTAATTPQPSTETVH